jgi:hypothetical protein
VDPHPGPGSKNGPHEGRNLNLHFMYRIEELAGLYVYSFLKVHLHHSSKIKSHKEGKKSRNQGFS